MQNLAPKAAAKSLFENQCNVTAPNIESQTDEEEEVVKKTMVRIPLFFTKNLLTVYYLGDQFLKKQWGIFQQLVYG